MIKYPICFFRLGSAVANIGDLNLDGVQDFAVSALDFSSGKYIVRCTLTSVGSYSPYSL